MNVFISSDIEGTCGIAAWHETEPGHADGDYAYFRAQMNREVAAACRAALAVGAADVLVKDAHDSARNIDPSALPEGVRLNRGWSGDIYSMMSGIQHGRWDAAVFTGYHAAACSVGNPLSHTMNLRIDRIEINGVRASEFTINAYMAGMLGIPVCFVSGDKALCDSARKMIPAISTVVVNEGDGASSTSIHPSLAVWCIEERLKDQLASGAYKRCTVPMPDQFDITIRYKEHAPAYRASFYPGASRIDEKTIHFTCTDYIDAMCLFQFVL